MAILSFQMAHAQIPKSSSTRGIRAKCTNSRALFYPCKGVDLLARMSKTDLKIAGGSLVNDIWGWKDPSTGREYALVGTGQFVAFVDVTDPVNPTYTGKLPGHDSKNPITWRDMKVYSNHMYVTVDGGNNGMQVFDLKQLRNFKDTPIDFTETAHYDGIKTAHNLAINEETGYAYITGYSLSTSEEGAKDTCGGKGLHMVNLQSPGEPVYAGCFADLTTGRSIDGYTHDAQCLTYRGPDTTYRGREICIGSNETHISIADVTNKAAPVILGKAAYPNVGYAHQGWLSVNQGYFFMNDELDEFNGLVNRTRMIIWDLRDLEDPLYHSVFNFNSTSPDHNLYVHGNYVYATNYTTGLRIVDISSIGQPEEIAFFDTHPGTSADPFAGAWSSYRFSGSGTIIVGSEPDGLLILDLLPGAGFASTSASADEGDDSHNITIKFNPLSSGDITLNYRLDGTATEGTDYSVVNSGTIAVKANASSVDLPVTIEDDDIYDNNETVIVTLISGAGYAVGSNSVYTLTITDNDEPPLVTFASNSGSVDEDENTYTITAQIMPAPVSDFTLNYSLGGSAIQNTDYHVAETASVTAGATSIEIPIMIIDDGIDEHDETIILTLTGGTGYAVGNENLHTITIMDNDTPEVAFSMAVGDIDEGGSMHNVTVKILPASIADFTLHYSLGGTAMRGTDYTASETVDVKKNTTSADIPVTIVDDGTNEENETVILTLTDGAGYDIGSTKEYTLTITDNDKPVVEFASALSRADEGDDVQSVRVNLSLVTATNFTLNYSLEGSATRGKDYTSSRTVEVEANTNSVDIRIKPLDDTLDENNETVILTLTDGIGYNVGSANQHTLTITDNDIPELVFASPASSVAEEGDMHNVRININPASIADLTLTYDLTGSTATEGTDYSIVGSGSLDVTAGAASVNIPIRIADDGADEHDETVVLTLTVGTGYDVGSPGKHTLTITDNDTPQFEFTSPLGSAGEGSGTQNVSVTITPSPAGVLELNYTMKGSAIEGADYISPLLSPIPVPANSPSVNIPLILTDDNSEENDETIILTLMGGTGYKLGSTNQHTLTITDNDRVIPPMVSFALASASVAENAGIHNVKVSVSPAPANAFTLNYSLDGSAARNTDYTSSGTVSVTANAISVNIPIMITDDDVTENSETVLLTLTDGDGYTVGSNHTYTLTITDNDAVVLPEAAFASPSGSVEESVGTHNVTVNFSTAAPAGGFALNYSLDGSATRNTDYTSSGTVSVTANAISANIPIMITDDDVTENSETVLLILTDGDGYTVGSNHTYTLTITDNDAVVLPEAAFASPSGSVEESVGTHNVTVNFSTAAPAGGFALNYSLDGSAARNTDYTSSGTVSVTANAISVNIPIMITDDDVTENNETVLLTLTDGDGYTVGSNHTYTLTITDNDALVLPEAAFASSSGSVAESVGTHNVTVNFSTAAPAGGFALNYRLDGSAARNTDYTSSGTVSVTANAISVNIPIMITDDDVAENNETVLLTLTDGDGYTVGSNHTYTLTITDNDALVLPEAAFASPSGSVEENVGTHNVAVNFSTAAPAGGFVLNYRLDGSAARNTDYTSSGTVSVTANSTSVNIPILITDDDVTENNETVLLTLTDGNGYTVGSANKHTLTITDNDGTPPVITFKPEAAFISASGSVSEDVDSYTLPLQLSVAPEESLTLNYQPGGTATEGIDYRLDSSGTVSVATGVTEANILITIIDDNLEENHETITLTLTGGTGYDVGSANVHTLTITNNDAAVTLSASPNPVPEGEAVTAMVTLSKIVSSEVTIPLVLTSGTAENGDYDVLTSIIIRKDELSASGVIATTEDDDLDHETFTVTLGTLPAGILAGTENSVEITITDAGEITSVESLENEIQRSHTLEQNYPNPFNPSTAIEFSLNNTQRVTLTVYDLLGQKVRTLVDDVRQSGRHKVSFDGTGLASDTYVYVLRTEKHRAVKIMTLLK